MTNIENENSYQDEIDDIDIALWDVEMAKGKPHAHFEVVGPETAELYRKASETVGSVALREVRLISEEVFDIAEKHKLNTQGYANLEDRGYVGFEVSTVADKNGQHPEDGTQEFYDVVTKLKEEIAKNKAS